MICYNKAPIVILAILSLAAACNESEAPTEPPAATTARATPEPLQATSAGIAETLRAALDRYEAIRSSLAADRADGVASAAKKLSQSAKAAAANVPAKLKPHVNALANSAGKLAAHTSKDLEVLRTGFGEVSRHMVALLASEPALRKDHHVFECPMAKGYKKWVQKTAEISNPYMGKKMLQCGGKAEWKS